MFGAGTSRFGSSEEADSVVGRQLMSGLNLQGLAGVGGQPDRTASTILDRGAFLFGRKGAAGQLLGGMRDRVQGAENWWGSGLSYGSAKSIAGAPGSILGAAGGALNYATGGMTAGIVGRAGALAQDYLGGAQQDLTNQLYGQLGQGATSGQLSELNAAFRSDESFKDFQSLVGGSTADRAVAREDMLNKMIKLREGDMKLPSNQIEMARMKGLLMTSEYMDYKMKHQGKEPPADWMDKLGKRFGTSGSSAAGLISAAGGGVGQAQKERLSDMHNQLSQGAMRDMINIGEEIEQIEKSDASPAVKEAARRQRQRAQERAALLGKGAGQEAEGLQANIREYAGLTTGYADADRKRRAGLSLEDLLKVGQEKIRAGFSGTEGAEDVEIATLGMGFRSASRVKGAAGERQYLASQLGAGVSFKDAGKMSAADLAQRVMEETGLSSSDKVGRDRQREFSSRIQEVLSGKGGEVEKAEKLASLRRDFSKDLTLAGQEKQDTKAKETDPNFRMLTTINQSIIDLKDKGIYSELQQLNQRIEKGIKLE